MYFVYNLFVKCLLHKVTLSFLLLWHKTVKSWSSYLWRHWLVLVTLAMWSFFKRLFHTVINSEISGKAKPLKEGKQWYICHKFTVTGGKNFGKILIKIRKSLWRVFPWHFSCKLKFSCMWIENLISWQFTPVDQFWVLPCQVPVQRLPRPSQSMPFGDVSETNGWEVPTKLAWTTWPETYQPLTIMRPRD